MKLETPEYKGLKNRFGEIKANLIAKNSEEAVKRKLWRYGYKVKHFGTNGVFNFDLLVDDKTRVEVKATLNWNITLPINQREKWDVLAITIWSPIKNKWDIGFFDKETITKNFPNTSQISINADRWKWQKSPLKVFGKPQSRIKRKDNHAK